MSPGLVTHVSRNTAAFFLIALVSIALAHASASAPDITVQAGEPVQLSGKVLQAEEVYLFLTGPGLAHNGVNLNRVNVPVVTGQKDTFTIVPVENDRWQYTWRTTRLGMTLKEGVYRVYMATAPVGRDDLDRMGVPYDTLDVRFAETGDDLAQDLINTGSTATTTTTPSPFPSTPMATAPATSPAPITVIPLTLSPESTAQPPAQPTRTTLPATTPVAALCAACILLVLIPRPGGRS